ncbi:hypothetical protein ACSSS7_006794 [Eimeria intestinalis]
MEAQLQKNEKGGRGPPSPAPAGPPRPLGPRGAPPPIVPPPIGASSSSAAVSPQSTGGPQEGAPLGGLPTCASTGARLSPGPPALHPSPPAAHPLGPSVRPPPPLQQKQKKQHQLQQPQQQQQQQANKQQQQQEHQPPRGAAPSGPQGSGAPSHVPPHREGKGNKQPRSSPHGGAPPAKRKRGGAKHSSGSSSSSSSSGGQQQQQQQQRRVPPSATSADLGRRGRDRLLLDYAQHFVNTGERPQNFIRDVEPDKRFNAYFKLKELMELKRQVIRARATPAQCIRGLWFVVCGGGFAYIRLVLVALSLRRDSCGSSLG